jgi:transketolase
VPKVTNSQLNEINVIFSKDTMESTNDLKELCEITRQVRTDLLTMLNKAGSGHTGGSLSAAEILTALYCSKMKHDPKNPKWEDRDMFVLSKGHAAPALYAVLARCGYFDPEEFNSFRKAGSPLQGHPDINTPGVEISTGSLGQGLSIANGMALGLKLDKKNARVYVLMGDGEIEEGQIWEAAMSAAHYKIDNLCAFLDYNGLQIDGHVKDIMNVDPLPDKWKSFGWHVFEVDGHDIGAILDALHKAEKIKGKPSIIICKTIKGKGVSFFENKVEYHGVAPTDDELERALKEL